MTDSGDDTPAAPAKGDDKPPARSDKAAVETNEDAGKGKGAAKSTADDVAADEAAAKADDKAGNAKAGAGKVKADDKESADKADAKAKADDKAEDKAKADKAKAEDKAKADKAKAEDKAKADKAKAEDKAKADKAKAEDKAKADKAKAEDKAKRDAEALKRPPPAPPWWRTLRADPPPQVRVLLAFIFIGMIFFLWWFVTRGGDMLIWKYRGFDKTMSAEFTPSVDRIVSYVKIPSPGEVFASFNVLWNDQHFLNHLSHTLERVFIGVGLAALVGVTVGVLAAAQRGVNAAIAPLVIFLRSVPMGPLLPLTMMLFGGGETQKTRFIFLAIVAFVFSDTVKAVSIVPERYVETAQTLGASRWQIIRKVLVPLALPEIVTSLRFQLGLGLGYITLAEINDTEWGIGSLLNLSERAGGTGGSAARYLTLILIAVVAFTMDLVLRTLQRGVFAWRKDLMSDGPAKNPPGTGTGPAGGAPVKPAQPARDPAAEAAALAMFEAEEKALASRDDTAPPDASKLPADAKADARVVAEAATAKSAAKPAAKAAEPAAARPGEPAVAAPRISGGMPAMTDLGKPLVKPPVVAFDKVTKTYGHGSGAFTAIKDVSFAIEDYPGRGELVSILGPSGCGKSTVIRMIAGLLPQFPQTSGTVLVDGKPIYGPGPDRGMVFQDYTSFDNRSVLRNVAFGLECRGLERQIVKATRKQTVTTFTTQSPHGFKRGAHATIAQTSDATFDGKIEVLATPKPDEFTVQQQGPDGSTTGGVVRQGSMSRSEIHDRAKYWIEKVGLNYDRDAHKYPHELSGGMRQRVAIARTLILEPRIILMDEPFGALDPPTRTRMQDNLVALWREQSPTIFFITHSIEEAVFLGDHIMIFSNSPGTVLKQIRVPPPDRPSLDMQKDRKFIETVLGIREIIDRLESSNRAGD